MTCGPAARADGELAVAEDVRLGYVTAGAAKTEYGVVVDDEGQLDGKATEALRLGGSA